MRALDCGWIWHRRLVIGLLICGYLMIAAGLGEVSLDSPAARAPFPADAARDQRDPTQSSDLRAALESGLASGLAYEVELSTEIWVGEGKPPENPALVESESKSSFKLKALGADFMAERAEGELSVTRNGLAWKLAPAHRQVVVADTYRGPELCVSFLCILLQTRDEPASEIRNFLGLSRQKDVPQITPIDGGAIIQYTEKSPDPAVRPNVGTRIELKRIGRKDRLQIASVRTDPEGEASTKTELIVLDWTSVNGRDLPRVLEYRASSGNRWSVKRWTVKHCREVEQDTATNWAWPVPPEGWRASCPRLDLAWTIGSKVLRWHGVEYVTERALDHELPKKLGAVLEEAKHTSSEGGRQSGTASPGEDSKKPEGTGSELHPNGSGTR